jgi:hypothetical protein
MHQKNHSESQLTSELISLIKTTSETLQNIVRIAERLLHQANAERRLAHKSRRMTWSLRVETQCALSPLCFLLGGGYLQQGFLLLWRQYLSHPT